MLCLSRTVRFNIDLSGAGARAERLARRGNTFAGWPSYAGLTAYYELDVVCRGAVDPTTGYMVNISSIDAAVRDDAIPLIERAVRQRPTTAPADLLPELLKPLQAALDQTVDSIRWRLTPYYSVAMSAAAPQRVLIRQQFEFSAAHRLHAESLSEAENRAIFGKCHNVHGHGHNYRLEPAVSIPLGAAASRDESRLTLPEFERIVDQTIVQRFDHKHLNMDTAEFATANPSVENIAKVCFELLQGPLSQRGARLEHVTIWETGKTSCTYPAPSA